MRAEFQHANLTCLLLQVECAGGQVNLNPQHIVFATGMSGYPHWPSFPGTDSFCGKQLHSSMYQGGADWKGCQAVVIGSNTSAHDIAQVTSIVSTFSLADYCLLSIGCLLWLLLQFLVACLGLQLALVLAIPASCCVLCCMTRSIQCSVSTIVCPNHCLHHLLHRLQQLRR